MAEIEAINDLADGSTDDEGASTPTPFATLEGEASSVAPETLHVADTSEWIAAPAAPDETAAAGAATEGSLTQDGASATPLPARLTAPQQVQRTLIMLVAGMVCAALLAPVVLALVTAVVAIVADALALADILWLMVHGELMQADIPLRALGIASRLGLLAIGYLGLCCALMTLLAGLLGRGRGRLFIIPGGLLTASALALFATSVALAWPLLAPLELSRATLLAIALYLTFATVALTTLLADTRQTRRRWLRARTLVAAPRPHRDREPSAEPPTLAGA